METALSFWIIICIQYNVANHPESRGEWTYFTEIVSFFDRCQVVCFQNHLATNMGLQSPVRSGDFNGIPGWHRTDLLVFTSFYFPASRIQFLTLITYPPSSGLHNGVSEMLLLSFHLSLFSLSPCPRQYGVWQGWWSLLKPTGKVQGMCLLSRELEMRSQNSYQSTFRLSSWIQRDRIL